MLALQILGPVVLRRGAAALPVSVKKSLALLLLLAREGAMSRSRVAALLWPDLDEPTARRNLRRELARLREAGAGLAVCADGDGLHLDAQVACDVSDFEHALTSGQPDAALALWRGPPADGLRLDDAPAFDDWLERDRERLMGLRRRALEASAAAHESAGALETALQRIDALLSDDPLQEQRHRDAMRLHAACGRREEALAQYERCCALLKTELDLQPMAETTALLAQLRRPVDSPPDAALPGLPGQPGQTSRLAQAWPPLTSDSTTDASPHASPHASTHAPTGAPAEAPRRVVLPDHLPFVGRVDEVAALELAWLDGRTLLIEGQAGVGKSRLMREFAASHGPFAFARCRPGDADVPYAAFTRGLRALTGPTPALGDLPAWIALELRRLLPELGGQPAPLRSAPERGRFVEACTQGWLALAADNFDAVLMDDWHHADAASQALLGFISQRRRELSDGQRKPAAPGALKPAQATIAGAREVLIYRPELGSGAAESLQQMRLACGALHLALGPLSAAATLDLVRRLSGAHDPTRFAARLAQATAGNPFFLAETLRHLAEQGVLGVDAEGVWRTPFDEATRDYRELLVPASVRETVFARVQRLPAAARRVLEAAALAGEPFAPALLAPACALSEMDTVLAIEQALQVQLLREHEAGGFAMAHDLVQQAQDAALTPQRRRLVHRRLALGAQAANAAPAMIAAHHEASGDAQRAVVYRIAAGDDADRLHALPEAMAHWQLALADGATPSQTMALHRQMMRAAHLTADEHACVAHIDALRSLATGPLLTPAQRIDALTDAARYLSYCERQPEGLALLDALPAAHDEPQQARILGVRADVLRELGRIDDAAAAARSALAMPCVQGHERAGVLSTLALIEQSAGRLQAALLVLTESIALCQRIGDDIGVARGLYQRGTLLNALGDATAAEAELLRAADLCQQLGVAFIHRGALYSLCVIYSDQTRPAKVLEVATRGWSLQPPIPPGGLRLMYRLAFVDANSSLGDLGAAWIHAEAAVTEAAAVHERYALVSVLATSLELLALIGEQARAAPALASLSADVLTQMPQHANDLWLAQAKVAMILGDHSAAVAALAQVTPAGQIVLERVQAFSALVGAELALAKGEPLRALADLPAHNSPGMSDEMRLRALAIRVGAEARSGALQPATVAAAQVALGAEVVHALAALYLHHALAAAQRAGVAGAPALAPADCAAHVARLAGSLREHRAQQAHFLRAWA